MTSGNLRARETPLVLKYNRTLPNISEVARKKMVISTNQSWIAC